MLPCAENLQVLKKRQIYTSFYRRGKYNELNKTKSSAKTCCEIWRVSH